MKLTERDKKMLIGGSFAAAGIILLYFLLPFYDQLSDKKREIRLFEKQQAKYLRVIKQQEKLERELNQLSLEEAKLHGNLLHGETPSLAAADLQKIVDTFTEKSKVKIDSVKVMDPEEREEGFTRIPVQIRFTSDLTRMCGFIEAIETNQKLLTILQLKIRVKNKRKPKKLSITLQVAGYMKSTET
ncbi:MAG: hypothetical protein GY868_08470 [Deltaproteobacteria bacterium]|nr:hypothetical protein [Deltaproteobacteria bacterium]